MENYLSIIVNFLKYRTESDANLLVCDDEDINEMKRNVNGW